MRHEALSIGKLTTREMYVGKRNGLQGDAVELADLIPDVVTKEKFDSAPVCMQITGEVCDGTAEDEHAMLFPRTAFEFHNIGIATTLVPQMAATGLDVGRTQTNNIGIEITQGITAGSRAAMTIGTDVFYGKLTLSIADVSGTDECRFGFRSAEAYDVAVDNYADFAALNVDGGDIKIETNLNDGTPAATDTTDDLADGGTVTLEVYVALSGVVTFKIDGAAPTTTAAFTFDSGDVVVPFFHFFHDSDLAGAVVLQEWEIGKQNVQ